MNFQEVEDARIACKEESDKEIRKFLKTLGIIFVICLIFSLLLSSSQKHFSLLELIGSAGMITYPFSIFYFVIAFFIKSLKGSKEESKRSIYIKKYKAYFISKALQNTFTNYTYNQHGSIRKDVLNSTGVINLYDIYHGNDLVTGMYKGINFAQSDATIIEENTDSDGDTTYTTIFKGRWAIFEFKKKFDKKLVVSGKRFRCAKAPKKEGFTKLNLESGEFNQTFNTYAQDGFEAYYILDPAFMERSEALANRYNNNVFFGFVDNRLFIGIGDGKDSMEPPSPRKPLDEASEMNKVTEDLKLITDIIDSLKLEK